MEKKHTIHMMTTINKIYILYTNKNVYSDTQRYAHTGIDSYL